MLGSYARLKALGIVPQFSVDEGPQTGFYHEDPDGNSVESNVCNYSERWAAIEHMQTSPDFNRRPLGVFVDLDKMIAPREAGATPWELHTRAWQGEFAPATPFDPTKLLWIWSNKYRERLGREPDALIVSLISVSPSKPIDARL